MKYILSLIGVFFVTAIATLIGQASKHPALMYIGIILGGFGLLALAVYLTRKFWGMIGWSLSSALFVLAALVITGFLSFYKVINAIAGFSAGAFFGMALMLLGIRSLAKKAHASIIIGEIFSWVSAYKIRSYVQKKRMVERDDKLRVEEDDKNLILILTEQMGYKQKESKEAADFIKDKFPYSSMEEKVTEALNYFNVPDNLKELKHKD